MDAVQKLQLGSQRCHIVSSPPRYGRLFAETYGTVMSTVADDNRSPDIVLHFSERPEPPSSHPTDMLLVEPTAEGARLKTDPVLCDFSRRDDHYCAHFTVITPTLKEDLLGYHFWFLFNRLLLLMDRMIIHAAAVRLSGGVSLFCGPSGIGKSTLAAALGLAGGTVLADDFVIARVSGAAVTASGVSPRMRLTDASSSRLIPGGLDGARLDIVNGRRKWSFPVDWYFDARPFVDYGVERLFLLDVGPVAQVRPARAAEAVTFLLENSSTMMRPAGRFDHGALLEFFAGVATSIPVFHLQRTEDFDDLPGMIDRLSRPTAGAAL